MRTKTILVAMTTLIGSFLHLQAQEFDAPDYTQIRLQITDSRSSNFYPSLMDRFVKNDTTLNLEEYRHLYYGFTLREDYIPYQKENKSVLEARQQLGATRASADCCSAALKAAQIGLEDNPFDLVALSIIPICYLQQGDTVNYKIWDIKLHGILDAIGSSGDGESEQTAFHVINIEHEYEILNRLGFELDQVEVTNTQTDFVRVKENPEKVKGIYFNFGACSNLYRKKYK